jgi:hypothetical protein
MIVECYGPFTNEELVGEALVPFRKQVKGSVLTLYRKLWLA